MKLDFLQEPELEFGNGGRHIDIRFGMRWNQPFDYGSASSPKDVKLGIVGTPETLEGVQGWLETCRAGIAAKESKKHYLFPEFPGFGGEENLPLFWTTDSAFNRTILTKELEELRKEPDLNERVKKAVAFFFDELQYLAQKIDPGIIICAVPDSILDLMESNNEVESDATEVAGTTEQQESKLDFRDLLKARAMQEKQPTQLILPATYDATKRRRRRGKTDQTESLQDDATRAWNFYTALYYKAIGTPWRLVRDPRDLTTCYMGISFYKTLDQSKLFTSTAQIFNERGDGVILKGGAAKLTKDDKKPYLQSEDAFKLLSDVLTAYRREHQTLPARIVLHKSSKFVLEEVDGFRVALEQHNIGTADFLSLSKSFTRLFRYGNYPPLRGTLLSLDEQTHILYTRGSVDFFATYPGKYPPRSLQFQCERVEQTPKYLAGEILALTKMNWNNTQFDRFDPITIRAARQVGDVLKYLGENDHYEPYYRFYM